LQPKTRLSGITRLAEFQSRKRGDAAVVFSRSDDFPNLHQKVLIEKEKSPSVFVFAAMMVNPLNRLRAYANEWSHVRVQHLDTFITRVQGVTPNTLDAGVSDLQFSTFLERVPRDFRGAFEKHYLSSMAVTNASFRAPVPKVLAWLYCPLFLISYASSAQDRGEPFAFSF
jgi:hypothetical protein